MYVGMLFVVVVVAFHHVNLNVLVVLQYNVKCHKEYQITNALQKKKKKNREYSIRM